MHYHHDMRLLQGNQNMFCDINISSATTTTLEPLHFCIQELIIVECSAQVQVKFCIVFSLYNVCNHLFCSSVSATKTSMNVLNIETKVLYVLVKSKPNWVIQPSAKTAQRMYVFGRSPKAEMLSRTRWYKNCYNFASLHFFYSQLGRMLSKQL